MVAAIRNKFLTGRREADFVVVCDVKKEAPNRLQELNDAQVCIFLCFINLLLLFSIIFYVKKNNIFQEFIIYTNLALHITTASFYLITVT